MITMALGGLWHGANWTFVIWGIAHGAMLIVHRAFRDVCERRARLSVLLQTAAGTVVRVALTLLCVCCCWVLFRAVTLEGGLTLLGRMWVPVDGKTAPLPLASFWAALAVVAVAHAVGRAGGWKACAARLPAPVTGFGYAALFVAALVLAPDASRNFIYFQF